MLRAKKIPQFLVFFLIINFNVSAQGAPGSQEWLTLTSPFFLGQGTSVVPENTVTGSLANPAAAGDKQRTTFDINYAGIMGLEGEGLKGHAGSVGLSIPNRWGVFTGSLRIITSDLPTYQLPSTMGLNFAFAKDVYKDLMVGMGVDGSLGSYPGQSLDFSAALSLGIIHKPGQLGPFQDFAWGFSIRDIGKTLAAQNSQIPIGLPFTAAIGSNFNLLKGKDLSLDFSNELAAPFFQDLRITLGSSFKWGGLMLRAGFQADLKDQQSGSPRPFYLPSFSIGYNFVNDFGSQSLIPWWSDPLLQKNETIPQVGIGFLGPKVLAAGGGLYVPFGVVDKKAPEIKVDYPTPLWLSPNNDGKKDKSSFPLTISDERYVASYVLLIKDDKGSVIRTIKNKDERPENQGLIQGFWTRLTTPKTGISIPSALEWNGQTDQGTVAPDGKYTFTIEAKDDNDNEAITQSFDVYLRNTPPNIALTQKIGDELIFSPDGDGFKDNFTFVQKSSKEVKWTWEVQNSFGQVVKSGNTENNELTDVSWDGKDNQGNIVPDGVYTYVVGSTDLADNSTSARMDNILINTRPTPVVLTLENAFFSPGTSSSKQTIDINLGVPVKEGLASWTLGIVNTSGETQRLYTGDAEIPSMIRFDGKNNTGAVMAEGKYLAKLSLVYRKGNQPRAESPEFTLDTTPPQVKLVRLNSAFSPVGNGTPTAQLKATSSPEQEWTVEVVSVNDPSKVVKTWTWPKEIPESFSWDGIGDNGKLQATGDYFVKAYSQDLAGNKGEAKSDSFNLDTKTRTAGLVADLTAFSPAGNGKKKKITLFPSVNDGTNLKEYSVIIKDKDGKAIKSYTGTGALPESLEWDGIADQGIRAADGLYSGHLLVQFSTGVKQEARTNDFLLDTLKPSIEISTAYKVFSPNGDGKKDVLIFKHQTNKSIIWKGQITDSKGSLVKSFTWKDKIPDLIWDGKDESGNLEKDNTFTYTISGEDDAGNLGSAVLSGLVLDNRLTQVFLTADKSAFSPGKPKLDQVQYYITPKLNEGILNWQISLFQKGKAFAVVQQGQDKLPLNWTWDGKIAGKNAPDGEYQLRIQGVYNKGDEIDVYSSPVILDVTGPTAEISTTPEFFSPDNDGLNDELNITLKVQDLVGVERWKFTINDPQGKMFQEFQGTGQPADKLTWDGISSKGEVVESASDYPFTLVATDKLGNQTQIKGTLSTDILVVRDGERLKIKISSLKFGGGTATLDLSSATPEGQSNNKTITRLAEILKRFNSYKIRVEGHSNRSIADPKDYENVDKPVLLRLSLDRANTVRQALSRLGVDGSRMVTEGMGDSKMLAPWQDVNENWKNRRVEFYLVR